MGSGSNPLTVGSSLCGGIQARRNGFQQINFPRYYIPLTPRGELFVRLRFYRGVSGLLPEPILYLALSWRDWYYKKISANLTLKRNKFAGVA